MKKFRGFKKKFWKSNLFTDFIKKIRGFFKIKIFLQNIKLLNTIFLILIIHKPSRGSRELPQKIWTRSILPF